MEDSFALSPISLLTIVIFLFIFNLLIIFQDFSSYFPYHPRHQSRLKLFMSLVQNVTKEIFNMVKNGPTLHFFFSNTFFLFASTIIKKTELPVIKKSFIIPTQVDNKMSVEEVKAIIDNSEALYERLVEEGEEYLLEKSEIMSKETVKKAFRLFDENQDGFIDENELKHVLCLLGYDECTKMECRKMIMAFDENSDGRIDFYEFVKLIDKSFS
ncbi:unnamed protein product [Cochlearia groenlandica]